MRCEVSSVSCGVIDTGAISNFVLATSCNPFKLSGLIECSTLGVNSPVGDFDPVPFNGSKAVSSTGEHGTSVGEGCDDGCGTGVLSVGDPADGPVTIGHVPPGQLLTGRFRSCPWLSCTEKKKAAASNGTHRNANFFMVKPSSLKMGHAE